jgi:hypothetical protein
VSRLLALAIVTAIAAGGAGCFYMDPINERPATELLVSGAGGLIFRGDTVTIDVLSTDPNGDDMTITWSATACQDGGQACEATPFDNGVVTDPAFRKFAFDVKDAVTTRSVRVVASTVDSYGAPALQDEILVIDIANRVPALGLLQYSAGPPGGATTITASVTDDDDDLDALEFASWRVMAPPGGDTTPVFVKIGDNTDDPARDSADETWLLEPDVEGGWWVEVTVRDPLGAEDTEMIEIPIGPDRAPCIADAFPLAPPPGAVMIVDEPRRFSVLVVTDDLDVFPAPPPNDPYRGAATFRWSMSGPGTGGAFVPITGAAGNFVEIDPDAYDAGDRIDLRVEIEDRISRTTCPANEPTCALDPAMPTCLQRQTWAVEAR